VEAALEHFLNPAPSVEARMRERLDDMHARFDGSTTSRGICG